jgi:hypothetical protein
VALAAVNTAQSLVNGFHVLVLGALERELRVLGILLGELLPRLGVALGRLVLAQILAEEGQGLGVLLSVLPLSVLRRTPDFGDVAVGLVVTLLHNLGDRREFVVLLVLGSSAGPGGQNNRH